MIQIKNLSKTYQTQGKLIQVVKNVSFDIEEKTIVSLIGKSGSGKSTLAQMIMQLIPPTTGEIYVHGKKIEKRANLALFMQIVFQDYQASLNPKMTVASLIDEPSLIWKKKSRHEELLEMVGLSQDYAHRYPHELSGGQIQRVAIARALSLKPSFLILDEVFSALDLITAKEIQEMLLQLQKDLGLTYLLISHDLPLVHSLSSKIFVMEKGELSSYSRLNYKLHN